MGPVFVKEVGFFLHDSFQGEMATDYPLGAAAEVHADEKWRGVRGSQTCGSEGAQAAEGCRTPFHPLPVTSSRRTSPATCSFSPARCNTRRFTAAYQTSHSTYAPKSSGKMTWMQDKKILIQKSLQGSMKTNSTGQVWFLYEAFFFHFMVGKHREYTCQPCLNPDTLQGSVMFLKWDSWYSNRQIPRTSLARGLYSLPHSQKYITAQSPKQHTSSNNTLPVLCSCIHPWFTATPTDTRHSRGSPVPQYTRQFHIPRRTTCWTAVFLNTGPFVFTLIGQTRK